MTALSMTSYMPLHSVRRSSPAPQSSRSLYLAYTRLSVSFFGDSNSASWAISVVQLTSPVATSTLIKYLLISLLHRWVVKHLHHTPCTCTTHHALAPHTFPNEKNCVNEWLNWVCAIAYWCGQKNHYTQELLPFEWCQERTSVASWRHFLPWWTVYM